jgi:hypothetical protein
MLIIREDPKRIASTEVLRVPAHNRWRSITRSALKEANEKRKQEMKRR